METEQKEYNKVYAEYQKIKKCIESCVTKDQLHSADIMVARFNDHNNKKYHVFTEILSPILESSINNKLKQL